MVPTTNIFGFFVDNGYLLKERAEGCELECEQVACAYESLIGPPCPSWPGKRGVGRALAAPTGQVVTVSRG